MKAGNTTTYKISEKKEGENQKLKPKTKQKWTNKIRAQLLEIEKKEN